KSYQQLFYLKDSYSEASIMMLTATCTFEEMNLIRENLHIPENNFTYIYANNQVRNELIYKVKKKYERNGKVFDEIKLLITRIQEGRVIIYCVHREEYQEVLEEL
ncbi:16487_t:CDS:1, partial [Dentiscutata erythropus]